MDDFDKSARGGRNILSYFILGRIRSKYTISRHIHLQACKHHQTFTTEANIEQSIHHSVNITPDSGGVISMIRASTAIRLGVKRLTKCPTD